MKEILFFLFLFNLGCPTQASQTCSDLFSVKQTMAMAMKIDDFKNDVLALGDISVFWGSAKPTWNEYNQLKSVLRRAEKINTNYSQAQFSANQIEILKKDLHDWALENHQKVLDLKRTNKLKKFIDANFGYFKLYEKINLTAGFNIFPTAHLDLAPQTKDLVKDAEKTVARNIKNLNELFPTTGFESKSAYLKYVSLYSEESKKMLHAVRDQLVVAVHRPENARFWIPLVGFQNQRVTGSSKGSFDIDFRNRVESSLTFQNKEAYQEKSVRYMPNYAEARPLTGSTNLKPGPHAFRYGSDLWVIKKNLYDQRATWTPGDSFSQDYAESRKTATSWSQMLIPWKERDLMVPYVINEDPAHDKTHDKKTFIPRPVPENFKLKYNGYPILYFEVQIWGPLTIDDVQAFIFKNNPPDKEFYTYLVSKNIEVWDERRWPAKKYTGEDSK